jgi:DNA primase
MGYIKQSFIETLLDRAHIDEVIGKFIPLKRAGANFKAKSPFSDDKTASLMVSPVKNIWKDFSSGKGGNVINFVMEKEPCSYPEAIEKIASIYNMQVEYENSEFAERKKEVLEKKEALRKVLTLVHELYKEEFKKLPTNHPAKMEVFSKREYTEEIVLDWGIGYAPENFLYDKLKSSGYVKEGEDLGLINRQWDKYSNRVIYPIHDANGLLIGLAGRDVSGKENTAKWINPTVDNTNILYNKSKVWYGLHKAKMFIRKRGEAFLTEGYNDVIGWHTNALENTVASCGTAITELQINELKKLTTKIVFCMDPDTAGKAAVIKQLPLFIKAGFRTEVITLDLDPDDFSRKYQDVISLSEGLENMFAQPGIRVDGFKTLIEHYVQGNEIEKGAGAKLLSEIISKINDDYIVLAYAGWLAKESKIKITEIKKWIKEFQATTEEETDYNIEYELPKEVKTPYKELEKDIKFYGMFMANNKIWMSNPEGTDGKVHFSCLSNFEIEVLQHMNDEKFPMKLLRIRNVHNLEKIFDTPSENLNTPQAFDNTVTGHGNFRFDGNRSDLLRLRTWLFDKMGNGRKIDVLGWQPDGKFWCWNNKITTEEGHDIEMNEHGIFIKDDIHYYVPSANQIYKNNSFKYDSQKRFRRIDNTVSFSVFALKVKQVHRDHSISALLFAIASIFQDIVVEKLGNFPILFLYGPGSSGKDELAAIVQSFTGVPQTAINLEGNVSTIKAQVREFAQFRNGISQLSEYKKGNPQLDGMLKALWDRRGYKRGNIESHVGTESIPIESSAILTGNDFPNEEPLILRLIWNEMTKNEFNQEEMKAFDELRDMREKGVSCFSDDLFAKRIYFQENFEKEQRSWKGILQELFPEAKSRIISNLSILSSVYNLFKDEIKFPFTQEEMIAHFRKGIDQQIRKINSASILNRFWDCFIAGLRGHKDQRLQVGYIISVNENNLYMQWSHTYNKVQLEWATRYKEIAPTKQVIKEQLIASGQFLEDKSIHEFTGLKHTNRSSATVVNMNALSEDLKNNIIGSVMYQINEGSLFENKTTDDTETKQQQGATEQIIFEDDNPNLPF